jgi:hypothetical protein
MPPHKLLKFGDIASAESAPPSDDRDIGDPWFHRYSRKRQYYRRSLDKPFCRRARVAARSSDASDTV